MRSLFCLVMVNKYMNYHLHYKKLISRGQIRNISVYTESHHILPRCLNGSDSSSNLVKLTPEEHYVAHLLLCKMYPTEHRLVMAAMMMCANRKGNKVYGWLRRRHAAAMAIAQSGSNNSQFNTVWVNRDGKALKVKHSEHIKFISEGWMPGRKPKKIKNPVTKLVGTDSPTYRWIIEQKEQILKEFDSHGSLTKILYSRGFSGRKGNGILSNWLKSKGRHPLIRRNSAGVA